MVKSTFRRPASWSGDYGGGVVRCRKGIKYDRSRLDKLTEGVKSLTGRSGLYTSRSVMWSRNYSIGGLWVHETLKV